MKWRLQEGQGEAIYEIGVEDNGAMVGLPEKDLHASLQTLEVMASKLGASTTVLRKQCIGTHDSSRHVAEVLVRQVPDDQQVCLILNNLLHYDSLFDSFDISLLHYQHLYNLRNSNIPYLPMHKLTRV